MRTSTHRTRPALLALAPALVLALQVSLAAAAPAPAAWGESSGYNAVETNRLTASALVVFSAPAIGEASGYDALEANRVAYSTSLSAPAVETDVLYSIDASRTMAAHAALASDDLGGMQEEALTALVASAPTEPITQFVGPQ